MTTTPTPADAAATAIARDARRVRLLTGLTAALWLAATAGIAFLLWTYYWQVIPRLTVMTQLGEKIAQQENRGEVPSAEDQRRMRGWTTSLGMAVTVGAAILAATVGALALACLGTMLLVFASRRATLRQIQVSLAEISAQLAELRARPATAGPPP